MTTDDKMLLRPLDFSLLAALTEGRNIAANLHKQLDSSRSYVNERLGILADYGLIHKVGPSETSGLYEITPLGRAALEHREEYGEVDGFEALIEAEVSEE